MPMEGVAYYVTDDEDCYNDTFAGRLNCLHPYSDKQENRVTAN